MAFLRSPYIKFTAINTNGNPLSGGKVHTYIAGTNTRADTWSDFGTTKNQNPITLNDMGQANIFLNENTAYKYVIEDALGVPIDTQDNIIAMMSTGGGGTNAITKDGLTITTAPIPFAQGLSSALGMSITAPFADFSAIKIPNNSWIRPQTLQSSLYLTIGEDPTVFNSSLHLTSGGALLSAGDGTTQSGSLGMGAGGINIVHYEGGSSNSTITLIDTSASIYSGDNSNLVLSASSATMYGGDSNLTLNNTYASLYQAGSGFYIDSTGIKAQGVAAGTITADGNLGLDSNGYIVKSTNPTESNRTVSTGLYNDGDGVLSIGTGGAGVATTFSISDGSGFIENNGVVTTVTWTGKTNIAVTNIATQNITYISIDINGNVIQQTIRWSPAEFSNNIVLGVVVHVNRVNVDAVNNEQSVMTNASQQVGDVLEGIGFVNIDGNIFGPNGATLGLTKTAGLVMNRGINWVNGGHENPHKLTLPVLSPVTALQYRMRDGTSSALNLTVVNPNIYDNGSAYGSAPAVPTNKFTVQRIYAFTSNNVKIQPGQAVYNSLAEAKANIQLEPFITESSIASNGILRGFLCIQQGTTSLTDASKVFFISAGKFGGSTGVGGLSVSTLQNAYDNSTNPEIVTNTDLGAVSIKRGSASDTDAVLEILNGAGTTTARINGDGSATLGGALNMGASSLTNIGSAQFNNNATAYNTSLTVPSIYSTSTGGAGYPFLEAGNLVISPRISGASRDVIISVLGTQADLTVDRNGNSTFLGSVISNKGVDSFIADHVTDTRSKWKNSGTTLGQIQATSSEFRLQSVGATIPLVFFTNGIERARFSTAGSLTLGYALSGTSATFSGLVTASTAPSADTSLTNKLYVDQLVQKVTTTASTATLTVDSATTTQASLTAQAAALTIASPTGGVDGRKLTIRIKDNGTARGITWNAIFRAVGVTLPATTVVSKILYVGAIYNSAETKWDVVSVAQEV